MSFGRIILSAVFLVSAAATASADSVRVVVERALVWTRPSGVSVVMTQLLMDQKVEVVRRMGDWYEIVIPPGSGGGEPRTGFISAAQVVLEPDGSPSARSATTRRAPAASAQTSSRKRAGVFNIDAAYRVRAGEITRTFTAFGDEFAEEGTIAANYGNRTGIALSVLYARPISGQLGIGVGADYYPGKLHAAVEAHIPHPFFFNQLRTATFQTESLSAHEAAVHVPVVWMPPAIGPLKILIFGGPTVFRISQTVVTGLTLDDQYPYDTVKITGVKTAERKSTRVGYHVGGDVTYFFTPSAGVGGGVRYSHAKITFDQDDNVTTDGVAGALQVVAGLRFRF